MFVLCTWICFEIEAKCGADLVQVLCECNLNAPEKYWKVHLALISAQFVVCDIAAPIVRKVY